MTEELKLILETIAQLGAAGKEAFIWWLALTYGTKIVMGFMVMCCVLGVPYILARCVMRQSEKGKALEAIGKHLGVDYWYWSEHNHNGHSLSDVVDAFNKRMAK
jgi:hypothetical protein